MYVYQIWNNYIHRFITLLCMGNALYWGMLQIWNICSKRFGKSYGMASELNCPLSSNVIGILYNTGEGVTKNWNLAFRWFLKGAKEDYSVALYNVGLCYFNGWGVTTCKKI